MPKTQLAKAMDEIQSNLSPILKDAGFRARGRTFNRATADNLVQVIGFQMGMFDPPGTTHIPGFRENLYGRFTVNIGVFVPEVSKLTGFAETRTFVQEPHCCIRARLGLIGPEQEDSWWLILDDARVILELGERLSRDALPFLERFGTRDAILHEWKDYKGAVYAGNPPRIVCAAILAGRDQNGEARRLLAAQARGAHSAHADYVNSLSVKLGLGDLSDESAT